jgi:FkbM family methyltransferase
MAGVALEQLKAVARRRLPARVYGPIRARRVHRLVETFEPRVVEHRYAGFPLRVSLEDPLAEGWYDHDWDEPAEIAALREGRLRAGARVLDVGAHQGVVALILARIVGPEGHVVAVEAEPHNAAVARRNAELNGAANLTVVHAAGGAENGVASFREGLNGRVVGAGAPGAVTVPRVTVDDLARRHGRPDVVLVDVEGYEAHVLDGAADTLAAGVTDVFVELHDADALAHAGSTAADVLAHFPAAAFDVAVAEDAVPPAGWVGLEAKLHERGLRCFVLARPRA